MSVGRDEDVRKRLLEAAVAVFARKGYDGASVREIVEAAGTTKPTLYYHFQSKAGIGRAIIEHARDVIEGELREAVRPDEAVETQLVAYVAAHFEAILANVEMARFLYSLSFAPIEAGLTLDVAGFRAGTVAVLHRVLTDAAGAGIVRAEVVEDAELMLNGVINGHMMAFLKLGIELNRERAARVVRVFLDGIAARNAGEAMHTEPKGNGEMSSGGDEPCWAQ